MHDTRKPPGPRQHTTRLRTEEFNAFLAEQGFGEKVSNAKVAEWLGVAEASVSRIRDKELSKDGSIKQQPGPAFISAFAKKLPADVPLQRFLEFGEAPTLAAAA
jgi:hypothetical protein